MLVPIIIIVWQECYDTHGEYWMLTLAAGDIGLMGEVVLN